MNKNNRTGWLRRVSTAGRRRALVAALAISLCGVAAVRAMLLSADTIRLTPVSVQANADSSLPADVQALEASTAPALFDRATTTEFTAYGNTTVDATFAASRNLRALKVYGAAPYRMSVSVRHNGSWTTVNDWKNLNLAKLSDSWHSFELADSVPGDAVRFEFQPSTHGSATGLKEVELWGDGQRQVFPQGDQLVTAVDGSTPPVNVVASSATPDEAVIGKNAKTFTFDLGIDPARIKNAYLVYDSFGIRNWVSVSRSINGYAALGGNFMFTGADWTPQVERIHPGWLKQGQNQVVFALPDGVRGSYSVRHVRVLAEMDNGANFVAGASGNPSDSTNSASAAYDGSLDTGWRPYLGDTGSKSTKPTLDLMFDRPTQVDGLDLYLANTLEGTIDVEFNVGGKWTSAGISSVNGRKLVSGWNEISAPSAGPADGVRLTFANGAGSSAEVRELRAIGSGVGLPYGPHFVITYPDNGQYFGRTAYIRGFLELYDNGSGPAKIFVGGKQVDQTDGAFGVEISKDDVGLSDQADETPWSVDVEALYPDGQHITTTVVLNQQGEAAAAHGLLPSVSAVATVGQPEALAYEGAKLDIGPDAVDGSVNIKITPLAADELPPLDPGMTNVTHGPHRGYRFTPHPYHFKKAIKVTLPYDKGLLPAGMTEGDIKTYFFDEERGHWVSLEKYKLNQGKQTLTSLTDHFTDMINATVVVPEHPQAVSFNPTQIKGIKAADPGAGINLIKAPQANNTGDARLSYPIEVPAGRAGMQPQLAIQYNSSGGNGWLGLGWDLSMPSISIDTRWGAPRYDEAHHEELYLFNGQQLVRTGAGSDYVEYRPRIEGAFQRIRRYGDRPDNYYWVVTDKDGSRSVYGGDLSATLRSHTPIPMGDNASGRAIFTWYLSRQVDPNGNTVDYQYSNVDSDTQNGGEGATYTYPEEIRYTGHINPGHSDEQIRGIADAGASGSYYRVRFVRETGRLDSVVDGRPGFKTVMDQRLKNIYVEFVQQGNAQQVRSYELDYTVGAFDKTLLAKISQYGADNSFFNEHRMTYFTMPTEGDGYDAFAYNQNAPWTMAAAGSGLSQSQNQDSYFGAYYGFTVGPETPHAGVNGGQGDGDSNTLFSLADINGDGLPDFLSNGSTYYKNDWSNASDSGAHFQSTSINSGSLDSLGYDHNHVTTFDVGVNLDSSFVPKVRLSASAGASTTTVNGSKMLTDINGDGLVDQVQVSGGQTVVRLNTGSGFATPIYWNGGADLVTPPSDDEVQDILDHYPLSDPVRAWTAPFKGTVNISGTLSKPDDVDTQAGQDGVRVDVYKGNATSPLWSKVFSTNGSVNLHDIAKLQGIAVDKGETLYVKVDSIQDGSNDLVESGLTISYSDIYYTDANRNQVHLTDLSAADISQLPTGQDQFSFDSQNDFAMASAAVPKVTETQDDNGNDITLVDADASQPIEPNPAGAWTAPYKGNVTIHMGFNKQTTSEDLRLRVIRLRHSGTGDRDSTTTKDVISTFDAAAGDPITFTGTDHDLTLSLLAGDELVFDVILPNLGSVDVHRFSWQPEIRYSKICIPVKTGVDIDDPSTYSLSSGEDPGTYYDSEQCHDLTADDQQLTDQDLPGASPQPGQVPTKLYVFSPTPVLNVFKMDQTGPVRAWVAPRDGLIRIVSQALKGKQTPADIHVKVQGENRLIREETFAADDVSAWHTDMDFTLTVHAGERLYFSTNSRKPTPVPLPYSDDDSAPAFIWQPEILYADPQHCYVDSSGNQQCLPVSTGLAGEQTWRMHFGSLPLGTDLSPAVDCDGARVYLNGYPSYTLTDSYDQSPGSCYYWKQVPADLVHHIPAHKVQVFLTQTQRQGFNLYQKQYFVPPVNRAVLSWEGYDKPLAGYYRQWSFVSWNGNKAWDPGKLVLPPDNAYDDWSDQKAEDMAEDYYYRRMKPLVAGDKWHSGEPIWEGPAKGEFISAGDMRSGRIGGNVTGLLRTPAQAAGGGIGILRRTTSQQNKVSFGAGPAGASFNDGSSDTQVDLIDLNGDRYPDQVSAGGVVFNNGNGGFATSAKQVDFSLDSSDDAVRHTYSKTLGLSFSLGYIFPKTSSNGLIKGMEVLGPSVGTNYGSSAGITDFIDINGDGLPDRVSRDGPNINVRLNLGGERFGAEETWAAGNWDVPNLSRLSQGDLATVSSDKLRVTDTVSASAGASPSVGVFSADGSYSVSGSRTLVDLRDMNGDGLPDLVMKVDGENFLRVRINRGDGFDSTERHWYTPAWGFQVGRGATATLYGGNDVLSYQESWTQSSGVGMAHVAIPIPIPFCCVLWPHVKIDASKSNGEGGASLQLIDVNGDGFPDQVYRSSNSTSVYVKTSKIGKTNLLKLVRRPLGGSIELDYARSGNKVDLSDPNNQIDMNSSKWVLSQAVVKDGQGNQYPTSYRYFASGNYDRSERENYGYGHVQEIRADGATTDTFYHNQDYTTKGLAYRTVFRDSGGNVYTRDEQVYDNRSLVPAENGRKAVRFPALVRSEKHFYEGQISVAGDLHYNTGFSTGIKRSAQDFDYDDLGNVTSFTDEGDLDNPADDVHATIGYSHCTGSYIVGKAESIEVYDNSKQLLRRREADVNCVTGNVGEVRQYVDGNKATTDLAYTDNGNLASVTGPANAKGDRYGLGYDYDNVVQTYPVKIRTLSHYHSDTSTYHSTATYDYRWGKPLSTTDLNGNVISYAYDDYGRTTTVVGPYETDANPTLQFEYAPYVNLDTDAFVSWAKTRHYDQAHPTDTIDTILFVDGMRRVLQTKKDASVAKPGQAPEEDMIVSGRVVFDNLGRTIKQYYPVTEKKGNKNTTFDTAFDSVRPTTMTYDVLNRNLTTTLPDQTTTIMSYGFGPDRDGHIQFHTTVTDADHHTKETFRDARQLITAVKEYAGKQTLWTSYAYDPLKEIVRVEDQKHNKTTVTYDQLGRRTAIDNPDTGKTQFAYDRASNLTSKTTAVGDTISYAYDFNRLTGISYPRYPDNNVTYAYGDDTKATRALNQVGRMVTVKDQAGTTSREYGKLGETTKETMTVSAVREGPVPTYVTKYHFDTFGRLLTLTLPNGEVIHNEYDSGGNVSKISGAFEGRPYDYLKSLTYDKFEQRLDMALGNGDQTHYTYDAKTRRLATLSSTSRNPRVGEFQNLKYGYDNVGNITSLANDVAIPANSVLGGPAQQNFKYDDLYRLVSASGSYTASRTREDSYTLDMAYDGIHNITHKTQVHTVGKPGATGRTVRDTTYDWAYAYTSSHPHAPTLIGTRAYSYDANGNQLGYKSTVSGTRRAIDWDEENRIQAIHDPGKTASYAYDDTGRRIVKRGRYGETVYVNQFFTVRNGALATEHVYAGKSRIVSKLMPGKPIGTHTGQTSHGGGGVAAAQYNGKTFTVSGTGAVTTGGASSTGTTVGTVGSSSNPKPFPGQGLEHRSDRANEVARNTLKNKHLNGGTPGGVHGSANSNAGGNGSNAGGNGKGHGQGNGHGQGGGSGNGGGSAGNGGGNGNGGSQGGGTEFLYFFHPDHLGSTSFVTDKDGKLYEHVEYFPFGETWVNEANNTWRTPYLFTSKELDSDTQLYYYGARYYDPRTSVWQSADPIDRFTPSSPTIALNPYQYGLWNPICLNDPTGRDEDQPGILGKLRRLEDKLENKIADLPARLMGRMQAYAHNHSDTARGKEMAENNGPSLKEQKQEAEAFGQRARENTARAAKPFAKSGVEAVEAWLTGKALGVVGIFSGAGNKLHHIFGKEDHNLGALVKEFGSERKAFNAMNNATQRAVKDQGLTGVFETTVRVGNQDITVRGKVVDGVARIGTAFKSGQ